MKICVCMYVCMYLCEIFEVMKKYVIERNSKRELITKLLFRNVCLLFAFCIIIHSR